MKRQIQNSEKIALIRLLRKKSSQNKANIWRRVATLLEKPKRKSIRVNLSRVNRYSNENDKILIPGKVLSSGLIAHPVTVASFAFSQKAKEKIERVGGRCLRIDELITQNPKGTGVKILV